LVYEELRRLAERKLAYEKPGQTLQPTALVHEAYLRLAGSGEASAVEGKHWNSRAHFFAAAAEAMRRILVENARRKRGKKHGSGRKRVDLAAAEPCYLGNEDSLAINDALEQLAAEDPQAAQLVQLRHFGGLSVEEAAELLGIARSTAYEHWAFARASLRLKLGTGADARQSEK
jgi:RNA polymerase sigma factor (TIGR02999 family)